MTKVGISVLDEYIAEVNERVEDDKNWIRVLQGLSVAHSFSRILSFAINGFLTTYILLAVVVIAMIDDKSLNALRAATNAELLSAIRSFLDSVFVVSFVALLVTVVFTAHRFFRDKKHERLNAEQERADLVKTIIEINEEMLQRHKLIQAETN